MILRKKTDFLKSFWEKTFTGKVLGIHFSRETESSAILKEALTREVKDADMDTGLTGIRILTLTETEISEIRKEVSI